MANSIEQFGGMNITPVAEMEMNPFLAFNGNRTDLDDMIDYYSSVMAPDNPYAGYVGGKFDVGSLIEHDIREAVLMHEVASAVTAMAAEQVAVGAGV